MLPLQFTERMKKQLGEEYPLFEEALTEGAAVRGLRASLVKGGERVIRECTLPVRPLGYVENGYILESDEPIGRHAAHHSGAVYMQDPGAMATLAAIDVQPDWHCLDLCAAPGGKSTQIAERLGEGGFLLANEYVPKRAKILVGNLERMGIRNAIVTSLDTSELARLYHACFDLVVCDAPCSGEGMFRKSEEALRDWSPETVKTCAERQGEILENAAVTVKAGGYLLYSTCTWSEEENELAVLAFLGRHPDFTLVPVRSELIRVTEGGNASLSKEHDLSLCRRCYPHKMAGEGQFIALLRRDAVADMPTILYNDAAKAPTRDEISAVTRFFDECFAERPRGRIARVGASLVLLPEGVSVPPRSVFLSGVLLGEIRSGSLNPSHQLISAYGGLMKNKVELGGDARLDKYLAGEEIDGPSDMRGWCALLFFGAPLGCGKASGGRIKNHYPKGLRNR